MPIIYQKNQDQFFPKIGIRIKKIKTRGDNYEEKNKTW